MAIAYAEVQRRIDTTSFEKVRDTMLILGAREKAKTFLLNSFQTLSDEREQEMLLKSVELLLHSFDGRVDQLESRFEKARGEIRSDVRSAAADVKRDFESHKKSADVAVQRVTLKDGKTAYVVFGGNGDYARQRAAAHEYARANGVTVQIQGWGNSYDVLPDGSERTLPAEYDFSFRQKGKIYADEASNVEPVWIASAPGNPAKGAAPAPAPAPVAKSAPKGGGTKPAPKEGGRMPKSAREEKTRAYLEAHRSEIDAALAAVESSAHADIRGKNKIEFLKAVRDALANPTMENIVAAQILIGIDPKGSNSEHRCDGIVGAEFVKFLAESKDHPEAAAFVAPAPSGKGNGGPTRPAPKPPSTPSGNAAPSGTGSPGGAAPAPSQPAQPAPAAQSPAPSASTPAPRPSAPISRPRENADQWGNVVLRGTFVPGGVRVFGRDLPERFVSFEELNKTDLERSASDAFKKEVEDFELLLSGFAQSDDAKYREQSALFAKAVQDYARLGESGLRSKMREIMQVFDNNKGKLVKIFENRNKDRKKFYDYIRTAGWWTLNNGGYESLAQGLMQRTYASVTALSDTDLRGIGTQIEHFAPEEFDALERAILSAGERSDATSVYGKIFSAFGTKEKIRAFIDSLRAKEREAQEYIRSKEGAEAIKKEVDHLYERSKAAGGTASRTDIEKIYLKTLRTQYVSNAFKKGLYDAKIRSLAAQNRLQKGTDAEVYANIEGLEGWSNISDRSLDIATSASLIVATEIAGFVIGAGVGALAVNAVIWGTRATRVAGWAKDAYQSSTAFRWGSRVAGGALAGGAGYEASLAFANIAHGRNWTDGHSYQDLALMMAMGGMFPGVSAVTKKLFGEIPEGAAAWKKTARFVGDGAVETLAIGSSMGLAKVYLMGEDWTLANWMEVLVATYALKAGAGAFGKVMGAKEGMVKKSDAARIEKTIREDESLDIRFKKDATGKIEFEIVSPQSDMIERLVTDGLATMPKNTSRTMSGTGKQEVKVTRTADDAYTVEHDGNKYEGLRAADAQKKIAELRPGEFGYPEIAKLRMDNLAREAENFNTARFENVTVKTNTTDPSRRGNYVIETAGEAPVNCASIDAVKAKLAEKHPGREADIETALTRLRETETSIDGVKVVREIEGDGKVTGLYKVGDKAGLTEQQMVERVQAESYLRRTVGPEGGYVTKNIDESLRALKSGETTSIVYAGYEVKIAGKGGNKYEITADGKTKTVQGLESAKAEVSKNIATAVKENKVSLVTAMDSPAFKEMLDASMTRMTTRFGSNTKLMAEATGKSEKEIESMLQKVRKKWPVQHFEKNFATQTWKDFQKRLENTSGAWQNIKAVLSGLPTGFQGGYTRPIQIMGRMWGVDFFENIVEFARNDKEYSGMLDLIWEDTVPYSGLNNGVKSKTDLFTDYAVAAFGRWYGLAMYRIVKNLALGGDAYEHETAPQNDGSAPKNGGSAPRATA